MMKSRARFRAMLRPCPLGRVFACLFTCLFTACATQAPTVTVPDTLSAGTNETLAMVVPAKGVQIYECRPRRDQVGAFEWVFVAPEADLFDRKGAKIGRHYAGPYWESIDGSKVLGTVKERADAPSVNAIPWLLLSAKSIGPQGSFSKVTSIQRVNTAGGLEPRDGCSPSESGVRARVAYSADYYFLAPK
jgi:Protein of unknown function (DUF3455)